MLESINLFLWLWKLCGVCQVRVRKLKNGLMTLRPVHPVFTFLALIQCGLTVVSGTLEVWDTIHDDTILKMRKGKVMFSVDTAMVSATVTSGILSAIYHNGTFTKILLDLNNMERYLHKVSRQKSPLRIPPYVTVSYIVNMTVMGLTLVYDWWAWTYVFESFSWSYEFTYVSFLATTALILKFVYVVSYVHKQFERINTLFRETLEIIFYQQTIEKRRYQVSTKIRLSYLNSLVLLHDKLYEIITKINVVFGPQNIFTLLYFMEQLVCCPFYSIINRQLFDSNKDGIQHFVYLYILWTVAIIFLMITVLQGCSKVKHEGLELRKIVARYLNPLKVSDFPDDYIILYLMKLNKPYPGFTVFGIVELQLPLARAMIASSMTYLIIFLQF